MQHIKPPYPEVFIINISWHVNGISYLETFNFAVSLTHFFELNDMYSPMDLNQKASSPKYVLKGIVCFLGAHYMTYMRQTSNNRDEWRLYDD